MMKSLEQKNVMVLLYSYGKVDDLPGSIDAPKSSRMVFRMKNMDNLELLNLFVETALIVSKKEKAHLCYTVAEPNQSHLIYVLNKYGFKGVREETESKGILYTRQIPLTEEEAAEQPEIFDGIECFMTWGTQGMAYKIGKEKIIEIREYEKGEFLD
uniref:hypothetical protein n=1 Tax=Agathobacter sp. TaxID=2021311 RepID=UPI004055E56F